MSDHRTYTNNLSSFEIKAWKKFRLKQARTHGLCDTDSLLYQLSYQANLELATLLVRNMPVEGEEGK